MPDHHLARGVVQDLSCLAGDLVYTFRACGRRFKIEKRIVGNRPLPTVGRGLPRLQKSLCIQTIRCESDQSGERMGHRASDLRLVRVRGLPVVHERFDGGESAAEQQWADDRLGTGEASGEKVALHPTRGLQEAVRPVGWMHLKHDASAIPQPKTESGADAQLAEERLFDTRSEPHRGQ